MFGRKAKSTDTNAQGLSERRRVVHGGGSRPFSYYTSRVTEAPEPPKAVRRGPAPADETQQRRPWRAWLTGWVFWALLLVVIGCAGKLLFLSSNPQVVVVGKTATTASYLRPDSAYAAAAQKLLDGSITNRNKLTVDTGGVNQALKHKFPELLSVSLEVPFLGNRPVLYVQPADPSLVLQTPHGNYALNQTGLVLSLLTRLPAKVPVVVDQSGLTPQPGKQVLPGSTVSFAETVAYQFKTAQLPISTFVLPANAPYELDVRLSGRPYAVRFNLQADALTQSGAAIATMQQLGSTVPSQYVDVRVPGRAYYK